MNGRRTMLGTPALEPAERRHSVADDLSNRGPADRARINFNEPHEVRWWTKTLGCTEAELKAAARAAGVMADKVRAHLKR